MKSPLRAANPRMVSPPGKTSIGNGPAVIVATMPRSGTHLMIDLLLNHFSIYRKSPLYVNLDEMVKQGVDITHYNLSGNVIKTHFPYGIEDDNAMLMIKDWILNQSVKVVCVHRDVEKSRKSHNKMFDEVVNQQDYNFLYQNYSAYWSEFDHFNADFEDLISHEGYSSIIKDMADYLGLKQSNRVTLPISKEKRYKAYLHKGLTRLLGHRAPYISTGIKLSK